MGLPYSTQTVLDSVEVDCGKRFHTFQTRKTLHVCKNGDGCSNNLEWAAEFDTGDTHDAQGRFQCVLDSGATVHCFNDLTMFHSLDQNAHLPKLRVANGEAEMGWIPSANDGQGAPGVSLENVVNVQIEETLEEGLELVHQYPHSPVSLALTGCLAAVQEQYYDLCARF